MLHLPRDGQSSPECAKGRDQVPAPRPIYRLDAAFARTGGRLATLGGRPTVSFPRSILGVGRTLLRAHAHPDDESSKGAATMARYADQGVRVVVVTCTGGEAGEILNPAKDQPGVLERMPELRRQERATAPEILHVTAHHWLGYRDSGMADSDTNGHPDAFANADPEEATGRLVGIIPAERPQVVLTYDEHGGYPHPDHIRTHEVSVAAFEAAGDPDRFPEAGALYPPLQLFYHD